LLGFGRWHPASSYACRCRLSGAASSRALSRAGWQSPAAPVLYPPDRRRRGRRPLPETPQHNSRLSIAGRPVLVCRVAGTGRARFSPQSAPRSVTPLVNGLCCAWRLVLHGLASAGRDGCPHVLSVPARLRRDPRDCDRGLRMVAREGSVGARSRYGADDALGGNDAQRAPSADRCTAAPAQSVPRSASGC
jgi:hypothetical protein